MMERIDKRFVSCPVCGRILMKCQGECNIDITCGKCNREIEVLVDSERVVVFENRRVASNNGQVKISVSKTKACRQLSKAASY